MQEELAFSMALDAFQKAGNTVIGNDVWIGSEANGHARNQDRHGAVIGSVVADKDVGHCCKVSDEAAFCLIQRPYISKNSAYQAHFAQGITGIKMLWFRLCVVHASPQYL
ncbi:hypothetical protein MFOOBP_25430 [Escherichia coli]|nr:hypothetical protein MFOOBP_25430 [Escherichia coli]